MSKIKNILVTGGAGFIGSHLVDGLIDLGYKVRVMDNLCRQIHPSGQLPSYFNRKSEFIFGDVESRNDWVKALKGMDAVFHEAAAVGVGQSMYEIEHYVKTNTYGTAVFLDILANSKHSIKKIVVAASMSSYGEGVYQCVDCGLVRPDLRSDEQLQKQDYNIYCPVCNKMVKPAATSEKAAMNSNSIYAITKKDQEEMVLSFGKTYKIPSVALRYFNVYGTRQSLSNPYTGVAAIFLSRVKNKKPPIINEDGLQARDFIHVFDIVSANISALENSKADYEVFNVGTGRPVSIREVAQIIINAYKSKVKPEITYKFRKSDVRHCYADISKITSILDWLPKKDFQEGINELIDWGNLEKAVDSFESSLKELEKRGLR